MGGISINKKGEWIKKDDKILKRYGVGEVTGGVHGGNRLGGNSLVECVIFGRIVAKSINLKNNQNIKKNLKKTNIFHLFGYNLE